MTGYLLGLVVIGGVLWLANGVRCIGAVSTGDTIGARPATAVLMIDLQSVFWDTGPYGEAEKQRAQAAIAQQVARARADGSPIIALRQEWSLPATKLLARLTMRGRAIAGTPGTELAAPFAGLADHVLVKRVQDGFETGELDDLLARLDVGRLRIVGLDFNYCVARTALAARRRGCAVEIVTGATLASGPADRMRSRLEAAGIVLA